ncbi:carboxypeptidase M32 [Niveibacterium terrae]|uniref:carboxypeptidase M32 n=1 Tax=Niveibacterium terrae TaxID=3373598 RepID=UPI003A938128
MSATLIPAYEELKRRNARLYRFEHLIAIASHDRATAMPAGGNDARAAAIAELSLLIHTESTAADLGALLSAAEAEPLSEQAQANLREMRLNHLFARAVPARLVEAKSLAGARCEHAWRTQRQANDWKGFLENFRDVLRLAREEALHLSDALGLAPYDALIERFEPGMRSAELDRVFGDLRAWLPDLIRKVHLAQAPLPDLKGHFPREAQYALSLEVMAKLGFDFDGGRLDESAHPYTGGVPEDVRLTTRYTETDFAQSLNSTIHETGHSLYEQGLPREWVDQPLGRARSMGIHESQSLFFEMQIARSEAFARWLSPLVVEHFGPRPGFDPQSLYRYSTRVAPGKIRVDADELTYPMHVILRYEIERALIAGELEAEDIPAAWDEKMQSLLGIDTRGDYRDGCLQDVHWTDGSFGYFPSYTLGAMYAAQFFAAMRQSLPDVETRIAAGDFSAINEWLKDAIWSQASRWETADLVQLASGEALNPAHFRAHLERRYLG